MKLINKQGQIFSRDESLYWSFFGTFELTSKEAGVFLLDLY